MTQNAEISVLWNVAMQSQRHFRSFGGTCSFHNQQIWHQIGSSKFLRQDITYLTEYTVSFLRSDLQSDHRVNTVSLTTSTQLKRNNQTN